MIVLGLIGLGLSLAYLGWFAARPEASWAATALKTGAVLALVAAGLWGAAPGVIVLGLLLGAVGDFALSRPGERWFLAGMAAFGLGHLAYAVGFYAGSWPEPLWAVLALGLLVASTELWLRPRTGALMWPVRGYVAVIAVMALAALTRTPGPMLAGVVLFAASDLLLAIERFVLAPGPGWLRRAVWIAYWSGQALILLGSSSL